MKLPKFLTIFLLISIFLAACSPAASASVSTSGFKMASMAGMPTDVTQAAKSVQTAYQFAVANPDVLKQMPCYCGCGAAGHTSNYSCYVKKDNGDGKIEYDMHATGCSICVDITQDTMRLMKEGKSTAEIKATIDQTYSRFGPSNMK